VLWYEGKLVFEKMVYYFHMEQCIFCKIVNKELPSYTVYEDSEFVAFLDIHPQSPGHVQVIPKEHHRWVWDVPHAGAYFEVVKKIAQAQQKAFDTDWILSKIVGDEVTHAHIWVFPNSNVAGDPKDFETNAEKIKKYIV
jgi:histidine triad (HIT) family protein